MGDLERARLSLTGLWIGDAFGETLFGDPIDSARRVAARELRSRRPWRWTDDTAMALEIVSMLAADGAIDPDRLAAAFARRWRDDPDRGYGAGAFQLMHRISLGADWRREARAMFDGRGSFGNGAAMRAGPIGAYFTGDPERACAEALRSAEPTHTHVDGTAGAAAVAIAAALIDETRGEGGAWLEQVVALTPAGEVHDRLARAAAIPATAPVETVAAELGTGLAVAAHDTVPFALWVAAHHRNRFEDALWLGAGQHGDRDTLGAIIGSLLILVGGVAAIPSAWLEAAEPLPFV